MELQSEQSQQQPEQPQKQSEQSRKQPKRNQYYGTVLIIFLGSLVLMAIPKSDEYFNPTMEQETTKQTSNKHEDASLKYAIFYNLYLNTNNIYHGLGVVVEQLGQWQESVHANATLYYTRIGDATAPFPCPNHAHCELLSQVDSGEEASTLVKVSEYCQEHPSHIAVYLHSKGTFHSGELNDNFRKIVTRSALSDQCDHGLRNTQCDVCSARFSPLPYWHSPGNMFTAKCSYINKLYPIMEFEAKLDECIEKFRLVDMEQENWSYWLFGTGRNFVEHWVHSHPSVQSCDVYPDLEYMYGYNFTDIDLPLDFFEKAPRDLPINQDSVYGVDPPSTQVRLQYRLFEFQQLYNETPANDSWAWTWYEKMDLLR